MTAKRTGPPAAGKAPMTPLRRLTVLAVAVLLLGGVGTAFVLNAASRAADRDTPRAGGPAIGPGSVTLTRPRHLAFVNSAPGPYRTHLTTVPAAHPDAGRTAATVECARFHAAAGTGICLRGGIGVVSQTGRAVVLDANLRTLRTFPLAGTPSRARVSPSGHLAAWTVFVGGESYGAAYFSTRTSIVDTRDWKLVPSLEEFAITLDGRSYRAADSNFWGVTFAADDDTFYATLGTAGTTYLVRGSLSRRAVTTLAQNVECPSLSPDGTRVAYKKRVRAGASLWREHVLDLRTLRETSLTERHSVDDQAVWLDDRTLAYALPTQGEVKSTDVWSVPADGTGSPRLLVRDASSPAPL